MPYKDKEKAKEYQKAYFANWYKKNKERCCKKESARKKELKLWIHNYKKELSCCKCGYTGHPAAIDFHHREPEHKFLDISKMICNGFSKKNILLEMSKCDVLCAICHRIETYEENQ